MVELLVVIGIVLILMGFVISIGGKVRKQAREVTERNAARQSLIAWTSYALDHNGDLLPGYRSGLEAMTPDGSWRGSSCAWTPSRSASTPTASHGQAQG